jgi:hypothetical protein
VDVAVAKHFVETGQCFGGFGKDYEAGYGAVEAMDYAEKYVAGLLVMLFDPVFNDFAERAVAGFVALDNFAGGFVDDDDVVVFVKYVHEG